MSGVAKMIFGGGDDGAAKKAAAESKQSQQIANDRQLAQLNESENRVGASRAAPRGRRLFESDQGTGGLASTLGG